MIVHTQDYAVILKAKEVSILVILHIVEGPDFSDVIRCVIHVLALLQREFEPVASSKGKVIAIIHRTNDDDDKLIVSANGKDYSDDAIKAMTEFQERFFESIIIR